MRWEGEWGKREDVRWEGGCEMGGRECGKREDVRCREGGCEVGGREDVRWEGGREDVRWEGGRM